jgi:presequence protease
MTETFGFELLKEQEIPELNTRALLLRHRYSGARLLSLENDDENKVFGISFRTPPADSTGVAHIMEHSVLCGSRKYPLKEPFIELVKGSLNTFLNAFTFPDKTCYPVASQNLQDFYNLIDVYMDAVLYPLIPPHVLQQEGWHYELESPDSPLTYKGVVFNEMKGAYSNPDDILGDRARMSLFPDTPYSVDSGGDPRHIPDLTYAQFKAFHDKYYHPSNAYIYFYGDDDPQERLRLMDNYLRDFSAIQVSSTIPVQPLFQAPRREVVFFDPGEEQDALNGRLVVNWLLSDTEDPEVVLGLNMLNHILLGTPASPLRKVLIDSGLGEDLAGGGLDEDLRQAYFSTGLRGMAVNPDYSLVDAERTEALIKDTLQDLAREGIDPEMVAASLNTVEFHLRENNTGSFPRGLLLMLRSLTTWLYDADPLEPLAFEKPLAAIKQHLASGGRYFEGLIERYFLNNPHHSVVILQPQPGLNQREEAAEQQRLEVVRKAMSAAELQQVFENAEQLKRRQETPDSPEALATLPSLKLEDLEQHNKLIPIDVLDQDGAKILYHNLFTNGIVYLEVGLDLHNLPQELLPYVPLFGRSLFEMGTEKQDFVRLSQRIGQTTGGIRPSVFTSALRNRDRGTAWLFLRGKSTVPQAEELLAILKDVLLTVRLDNQERFRQMVLEDKAESEASLAPAGHRVVNTRLRALFNEADWAEEQMSGIDNLFFIRELAQAVEKDWPAVLGKLEAIRQILVNRNGMVCNVTLDEQNWTSFQPRLAAFVKTLPAASPVFKEWKPVQSPRYEGLAIPAQVNFVGKGDNLYRLGYEFHGSVNVIDKYLGTTWLWEKIRVQGGAYGGFCMFSHRSGVFTFVSYRDPNLLATLENYDGTARFLQQLELDKQELAKSIIGTIGDMDAYQLPDAKGFSSMIRYLVGESDELRQTWREQVLGTTVEHFHAFGDVLEGLNQQAPVVVLGSADALSAANTQRDNWLQIKKVL